MADVVHDYAKSLDRSHTEQIAVAGLAENDLVDGFKVLCSKDGVTDIAIYDLRGCGGKGALPYRYDSCSSENVGGQPGQLRACVNKCAHSSGLLLVLWIHRDDVDVKSAHDLISIVIRLVGAALWDSEVVGLFF